MADKKISQLPVGTLTPTTIFPVVTNGVTSRISFEDVTTQLILSDLYVTGGTYSDGTAIFTNNTGGTFSVTGFTSGMTDSYTTGATLNDETIQFNNNIHGLDFYNINLSPVLSGKTNLSLFNSHTGNTSNPHQTSFNNLVSTAHTHVINDVTGLQTGLDSKFDKSGGTISGSLIVNTISATTYQNLPLDIRLTGGTYNVGTATFTNNTGGTFSVTGFTGVPYLGSIVPTSQSTGSTGDGFWTATQAGTYTNFGSVVVSGNSFATISRTSGGTFSISQTPLDLSSYIATTDLNYIIGTNKFNKIDNTLGGHTFQNQGINNTGVIGVQSGWIGAKIPVSATTQYSFSHNDGIYTPSGVGLLAYQNSTGGTISTVDMSTLPTAGGLGGKYLTTPSGTTFIYKNVKVTAGGTKDYVDTFQLQLGSATTTYNSYETQIDKIKSSKLIDTDARVLISANTVNISANTTSLVKDTNVISIVAKPNTVNPTLIQIDLVFPLSGITYASGTSFSVGGTVISNSTTMTGIGSRGFQNTVSTAPSVAGTATPSAGSAVPFTAPSTNFIRTTTFNQTGATYLHYYVDFVTTTGTTENIILKNPYLKVGGVTVYPTTYGFYTPNGTDVVKDIYYSDDSLIYGSILDKKLSNYQPITSVQSNYWSGATFVVDGDSMAKGHTTSATNVWGYLVANRLSMNYTNLGINGNRLISTGGTGTGLVDRVGGVPTGTTHYLVFIGTNDAASTVTIGTSASTTTTEFYGALNVYLDALITRIPTAKIGFITPFNRNSNYQAYVDAIHVGCKKRGIAVFDNILDGGLDWANSAQVSALTLSDTYHLNDAGHLRDSYKYEAFLKRL